MNELLLFLLVEVPLQRLDLLLFFYCPITLCIASYVLLPSVLSSSSHTFLFNRT